MVAVLHIILSLSDFNVVTILFLNCLLCAGVTADFDHTDL